MHGWQGRVRVPSRTPSTAACGAGFQCWPKGQGNELASWPVGKAEARRASGKAIRRGGVVAISYCMGSPRNASWLLDSYILATIYWLLTTIYWLLTA